MNKNLKQQFEMTLAQHFFIAPAFELYGGVAGLYDLGPYGTGLRQNIVNLWRDHFVISDDLQEVQCTAIVPERVLIASGHVAKFADIMLRDSVKKDVFVRADTYLEGVISQKIEKLQTNNKKTEAIEAEIKELTILLNQLDGMDIKSIQEVIDKYQIKSALGNPFEVPQPFNLMFQTLIGPSGGQVSYLRPETAQGIFMNFKRCFNNARQILPFGVAQVGTAFRNEIAPRNGLLRAREFEQAEIEFFVNDITVSEFVQMVEQNVVTKKLSFDDLVNKMPRQLAKQLNSVRNVQVSLFTEEQQIKGSNWTKDLKIEEVLIQGIIKNPYLLYYIAKTAQFLYILGLKQEYIRFRQHLKRQLAHYARDCWDADCLLVCGWTEIVGVADRSAYDLDVHSKASGQDLKAFIQYSKPVTRELYTAKLIPKELPAELKQKIRELKQRVEGGDQDFLKSLKQNMDSSPEVVIDGITVPSASIDLRLEQKKISGESITPSVIEPSFGIGRLIYCVLEHAFYVRKQDKQRGVFGFQHVTAPIKVAVICLLQKDKLVEIQEYMVATLRRNGIVSKTDDTSVQIGKKYAKLDELGVPFIITIDFNTLSDKTVTVRERDTMAQIRISIETALEGLQDVIKGQISQTDFFGKYPAYIHTD